MFVGVRAWPVRYNFFAACVAGFFAFMALWAWQKDDAFAVTATVFLVLVLLGLRDILQTRHAILRNYPVIGHIRFFLEYVRPELRQYFIEGDTEAAPFSRAQRSLVYQRAKMAQDNRPFGTQLD
ncbi:MAG TPA: FMN-binding glutamate synthase family protein, partial [Ramlibacter sp.]